MSFRLQLSSQLNASSALRGASVARALASLPSGLHRALHRQPITPSWPIGYSRGLATLSYTSIQGAVDDKRFQATSKTLDLAAAQFALAQKLEEKLKRSKQPFLLNDAISEPQPASTRAVTKTPNFIAWGTVNPKDRPLFKDGIPRVECSDKEVLIKLLACLPEVRFDQDVLLIHEGCDTGDYLPLFVSFLKGRKVERMKILLTNGNNGKLVRAANIAAHLLRKEDVFFSIANAFDGIPTEVCKYADFQKIFSPFRLMMVERPDKISLFIRQRLEFMRAQDVGIASFLFNDEVAHSTMQAYQLTARKSEVPGISVFTRQFRLLRESGEKCNSAFTVEAIEQLFKEAQGGILHMSKISTMTDEYKPINVIGVIFKKQPRN